MKCKVCGNEKIKRIIHAKDMNFGGDEVFTYFQCSKCYCLQIEHFPENMSHYYGKDYYSFHLNEKSQRISEKLVSLFMKYRDKKLLSNKQDIVSKLCCKVQPKPAYELISYLCKDKTKSILDVGCGDGYLLELLSELGWKKLCGVDLYAKKSHSSVKLIPGDIFSINENFDFIMFHHSFEHMDNPQEVLKKACSLLRNKNSYCMVCIPVSTCYAFKKYRENWVDLDAPRHFFLHSPKSIRLLAQNAGLHVEKIIYDSNSFQFIGSQWYERGILGKKRKDMKNIVEYAIKSLAVYSRMAVKLNKTGKGDQAIFLLKKI